MRCTPYGGPNPRGQHEGDVISCPRCEPEPSLFGSPVQSRDAEWERLFNGIPGQGIKVHRLWHGFRVHGRGTVVLPRQAVQERTQTLQELQGQASRRGWSYVALARARAFVREDGDPDELFAMRERDHGSVSADARTAGAVPRVFSAGAATGERLIILCG